MARALDLRLTRAEKLAEAERDLAEFEVGQRVRFERWFMPAYNRRCVVVDKKVKNITETLPLPMVLLKFPKPIRVPRWAWRQTNGYSEYLALAEVEGKDEFWAVAWFLEKSK